MLTISNIPPKAELRDAHSKTYSANCKKRWTGAIVRDIPPGTYFECISGGIWYKVPDLEDNSCAYCLGLDGELSIFVASAHVLPLTEEQAQQKLDKDPMCYSTGLTERMRVPRGMKRLTKAELAFFPDYEERDGWILKMKFERANLWYSPTENVCRYESPVFSTPEQYHPE
jgi:hypothetical protein